MADQAPKDVMGMLHYYLVTKAPVQLPANVKEWLVKYGPWIDLVLLILFLPAILLVLGLGAIALPFSGIAGPQAAAGLGLAMIAMVVQVVLMAIALPGLFARKKSGWNFAFYGVVFSLLSNLISFQILGGLISFVIGAYFLFQIRSYYS